MNNRQKQFRYYALTTAAEMIRSHLESGGIEPEDLGCDDEDEDALDDYSKQCEAVASQIITIAERFRKKHDL